jgi:hypothetical protein
MSDRRPTEAPDREAGPWQLTTRQLGGYVLIAALILALVRFVRGAGRRKDA